MVDLGNGIAVDFPDKPSVFLIQGYGELRIQKGDTRINGVTRKQLEIMAKYLKPKKVKEEVKDGQEPDITDVKQVAPGKARTTRGRSTKPHSDDGHSSK